MGRRKSSGDAALGGFIIFVVIIGAIFQWISDHFEAIVIFGLVVMFGAFFFILIRNLVGGSADAARKVAREAWELKLKKEEEARKNAEKAAREKEKRQREKDRVEAARIKAQAKKEKERLKAERAREASLLKAAKEKLKEEKAVKKGASKSLSMETFNLFNIVDTRIDKINISEDSLINFDRELKTVLEINENYLNEPKTIKSLDLDGLVFSGKYTSIIFTEGLRNFKSYVKDEFNFASTDISRLEREVFRTGVYHEYEQANPAIKQIQDTCNWKTLHRIFLIHTPEVDFQELSLESLFEKAPQYRKIIKDSDLEDLKRVVVATASQLFVELTKFEREATTNTFNENELKVA